MIAYKKIMPLFVLGLITATILIAQSARMPLNYWITTLNKDTLFKQQHFLTFAKVAPNKNLTITVDERQTYQTIDGFGFALTGGSAGHIVNMNSASRAALLKELFAIDGNNIGVSYLRLTIGASDLNEKVFSYDDLPEGETDVDMKKFSLGPDNLNVIPVLKAILAINPNIKILGSPWSPPTWMKTNNDTRGGRLKPEYYAAYANYFVKYIQAMAATGITIDAITLQNEPLHPGNNPSLLLPAPDEAALIKNYVGPAFKAAHISTKIFIYDHNADRPDYPISILDDSAAAKYIDGSAFHLYGGEIEALSDVHNAYPNKNIYFTEQMVVDSRDTKDINIDWPVKHLLIGATRNWSRIVLLWNLAADPQFKPFTDRGGCDACQGAVTIDSNKVTRNSAYYVMAHASKFVRPGSVRIASNNLDMLSNVAFKTPQGKRVLIVLNNGKEEQTFNISYNGAIVITALSGGAVGTYIW